MNTSPSLPTVSLPRVGEVGPQGEGDLRQRARVGRAALLPVILPALLLLLLVHQLRCEWQPQHQREERSAARSAAAAGATEAATRCASELVGGVRSLQREVTISTKTEKVRQGCQIKSKSPT